MRNIAWISTCVELDLLNVWYGEQGVSIKQCCPSGGISLVCSWLCSTKRNFCPSISVSGHIKHLLLLGFCRSKDILTWRWGLHTRSTGAMLMPTYICKVIFFFFRAKPVTYGGSQARG